MYKCISVVMSVWVVAGGSGDPGGVGDGTERS